QANATIVHIDSEPAEVYQHYNPDLEIVADIGATLRELSDRCEQLGVGCETEWYQDIRDQIIDAVYYDPSDKEPFTVAGVLPLLRESMADDDVLISDVGSHKMTIAQNYLTYEPNTCIISNGLAAMGIAVPGGIAADLAVDENIVVATGDGGFLMNAAEIDTATRLNCGYTILLFNDNDYGLISEKQIQHTGEHFGTELTNPDFIQFAESFGIDGYRPDDWNELEGLLEETISSPGMTVIEIPLARKLE
ncbi:MAG: thiamine pyrophosphate-dependent enzyme, partial [Halobacteriaceae archaeon]